MRRGSVAVSEADVFDSRSKSRPLTWRSLEVHRVAVHGFAELSEQRRADSLRCLPLKTRHDVRVEIEVHRDRRVAQGLLHDLGGPTCEAIDA